MEGGAPRQSFASRTHSTFLSHPGDAIVRTYLSDKEGQFSFFLSIFTLSSTLPLSPQSLKFLISGPWQQRYTQPLLDQPTGRENVLSLPIHPENKEKLFKYQHKVRATSLVTQLVKNLPAMQETWVQPLGCEDPLEKEMATHSRILAGKSHAQRSLVGHSTWGHKSQTWLSD